ncbi:MAG: hypothetical protein IJF07_06150, partial [Lachnospiraceae bacterium]|nr:hypothetical protein [Lachnospiraceae bacterium]
MSKQEKQYKDAMRIFEALSGIDEDLLERSEKGQNALAAEKKVTLFRWNYGRVAAAALCFVVTGVTLWGVGTGMLQTMYSSTDGCATNNIAQVEKAFSMEAADEAPLEQAVEATREQEQHWQGTTDGEGGATEGSASCTTNGSDTVIKDAVTEENTKATSEGIGTETTKVDEAPTDDLTNKLQTNQMSATEAIGMEEITESEARADEIYGKYVPDNLPEGYTWQSGHVIVGEQTQAQCGVELVWTRGLDSIWIKIERADKEALTITNPDKPETYNVQLYAIPYAETVPEEYREAFHNPVFLEKDFNLELVKARMKYVADSGDTDTERGHFAVRYEEGI